MDEIRDSWIETSELLPPVGSNRHKAVPHVRIGDHGKLSTIILEEFCGRTSAEANEKAQKRLNSWLAQQGSNIMTPPKE